MMENRRELVNEIAQLENTIYMLNPTPACKQQVYTETLEEMDNVQLEKRITVLQKILEETKKQFPGPLQASPTGITPTLRHQPLMPGADSPSREESRSERRGPSI